ncbi:rod shape-determining protein MreD [Altibacter sp. HG106]|uniref:rod shape-determining protein MreD n=1 Tax=Altibacter sp. HG106 TaxID=3023937 RepID=UPI002350122B|nr:rod shape-determining protein MreD [Altibacter sp. HG106]MDC7994289.1 rod shape-determining protein MreD [Altibacter sp. HG106]
MQNSEIITNLSRFIIVLLLQVLLLNHINFLGYINPYLYLLFILLFPFTGNKSLLIVLSFLLGLFVDIFGDSGGVHAAASVFVAWVRPWLLKFSFGVSYEYNAVRVSKGALSQQLTFISIFVFLHHLVLFSMEVFNVSHILLILQSTLFNSLFSILVIQSVILIFSRNS